MVNLTLLFKMTLSLSVMSSIVGGLIFLCKAILRNKLSVSCHYYIWILLILRLITPFAPESTWSIFNCFPEYTIQIAEQGQDIIAADHITRPVLVGTEQQYISDVSGREKIIETQETIKSETSVLPKKGFHINIEIISIVWFLGIVVLLTQLVIVNMKYLLKIKRFYPCKDIKTSTILEECKDRMNIKQNISVVYAESIRTPSLFGIMRPKLLLPGDSLQTLTVDEMRYICFHELVHLKRKDIFINLITMLLQTIHWFNPLIWFAFGKMKEDQEAACDANVLSYLEPQEYKRYGETIIKLASISSEANNIIISTGMTDQGSSIKRRIKMIVRYKKNPGKGMIVAVLIFAALGLLSLTNANHTVKKEQNTVKLNFTPVPVVELRAEGPSEEYIAAKSVDLNDLNAQVHFYIQQQQAVGENNDVYGFIEHKGVLYYLGKVASHGLEKVSVETVDRTGDTKKELQITGDMGASYREIKIIKYDEDKNKWYSLLKLGSPEFSDLDGDGQEEVLAVSTGSIPGYLDIYRFNDGCYEVASVTQNTGNDYAYLYERNGMQLIEAGKIIEGSGKDSFLYKYDQGKLIQLSDMKDADNEWRSFRVQGIITSVDKSVEQITSINLKTEKDISLPNNPLNGKFAGKSLRITFTEKMPNVGDIADRFNIGSEIVVTVAQYAVSPEGKTVWGAHWNDTFYVVNKKYYDIQGKEVDLVSHEDSEFLTPPQIAVPLDLEEVRFEQRQVDEGHKVGKLNAVQVAKEFLSEYTSPDIMQTIIAYELVQFNEKVTVIKIVGGSSDISRVYLKRMVRQDDTGIWSVVGYDRLSEAEKDSAEEGKLVAELPEKAIKLYCMKEEEGLLKKFILQVKDKTRYFSWENVANPTYSPQLILTDLNKDQEQELMLILVKGTGTGVHVEEIHIIDPQSMIEIEVENPLHVIFKNVKTQLSSEKVEIIIKGKSTTLGSEYIEPESDQLFADVAFGSIIDFEAEDNKLRAVIPGQIGMSSFVGDINIEYIFNGKMYIGNNIDFVPYD